MTPCNEEVSPQSSPVILERGKIQGMFPRYDMQGDL